MKNILQTISSLALIALLIGSSNTIFSQENDDHTKDTATLYNFDTLEQPLLFKFLQDRFFLELLSEQLSKQDSQCPFCYTIPLSRLRYSKLYTKLTFQLKKLKENEEQNQLLQEIIAKWNNTQKTDLNALKDHFNEVKTVGHFPNYLDFISIEYVSNLAFSEVKVLHKTFNEKCSAYDQFLKANNDTLNKIEQIVDHLFKVESEKPVAEQRWREIDSLSELLSYALIMKEKEADTKAFLLSYYLIEGIHERYATEEDPLSASLDRDFKEVREAFLSLEKPLLLNNAKNSLALEVEFLPLVFSWCANMYNHELNTLFGTHLSPTSTAPFLESNWLCHTSYQDALKVVRAIRDKYKKKCGL